MSCRQHSQNKVLTYSCLRGVTCMFGELSVVTKRLQAERYSTLRAPGVSVFQPAGKKSGVALGMHVVLHWACTSTSSLSPKEAGIFRVDMGTRKLSPLLMF